MLVPFRRMWCLSEPNIDGFFLSSLILQIGCKNSNLVTAIICAALAFVVTFVIAYDMGFDEEQHT